MIAIGIDTVEINRFVHFHSYTTKQLQRLFSVEEISYAMHHPLKSAERFAVRFAAKEAFLKAYSQTIALPSLSLLTIARLVTVEKANVYPTLAIDWQQLETIYKRQLPMHSSVSLTHSAHHAIAVVVLHS